MTTFNPTVGLVILEATLVGPIRPVRLQLALDTGAVVTLISPAAFGVAGYSPAASPHSVRMRGASGQFAAPRVVVTKLRAIDRERDNFPVLAHPIPGATKYDGLLGLDFLRGLELTADFRNGVLRLA